MQAITDIDALMNTAMDDIEDLPPVGVPPTGHYNLEVTASREKSDKDGGGEYIKFSYKVEAVNEVKNPEEADQAAIGTAFTEFFSPIKKDGTVNETGIKFLKARIAPFAAHFGTANVGDTLQNINKLVVAASLTRRKDKKDAERFNFNLDDVTVL